MISCPLNIGTGRRELAERLVDLIDGRGFLPYTHPELCRLLRCSPGACRTALETIRALEPPGVGSRDLGEFLTRQLASQGLLSPALTEICSSFLPQLAEGRYREISSALGLELPVVRQCARLIAALRPSPLVGANDGTPAGYILPDIIVRQGEQGLTATVTDRWCGRVRISGYYRSYLESAGSPEVRHYLRQKIQRARWVMAAMEQRQRTVTLIAQALLRFQREFFLGASACGMSVLALWFARYGAAGRPETLLVLAAIVVVGLGALWLKKNDGVLSEKMNLQFLPKKTSYAVLLVTCLASLAAVVVAMVAGDMVAYYLMFVMVAWLFALFVYYTVKMM